MDQYDVRRYALVCAVNAEIEAMKAANSQSPENQPFTPDHFMQKASRLEDIAYMHNDQML